MKLDWERTLLLSFRGSRQSHLDKYEKKTSVFGMFFRFYFLELSAKQGFFV